jgi:cbb3-type cytochrome oxidase maturation protein
MTALLYLIPLSIILGLLGLVTFFWTLRHGQYEDMEGAAARILTDDDVPLRAVPESVNPEETDRRYRDRHARLHAPAEETQRSSKESRTAD